MRRVNKGVVSRSGNAKLVCSKAKAGAGCQYRSVDYPAVERAIVENASWIASQAPSRDTDLDAEVAAAESHLETVNHQIVDFHSEVTRVFHRELTHL